MINLNVLLADTARGIYYKKWNLGVDGKRDTLELVPLWLEKSDKDYNKKTLIVTVSGLQSYRLKAKTDEFYKSENISYSIIELFDKIKAFYDLED